MTSSCSIVPGSVRGDEYDPNHNCLQTLTAEAVFLSNGYHYVRPTSACTLINLIT